MTDSTMLEIQAALHALLYAQARIIAKLEHGDAGLILEDLLEFKDRMLKELALCSIPKTKQTD